MDFCSFWEALGAVRNAVRERLLLFFGSLESSFLMFDIFCLEISFGNEAMFGTVSTLESAALVPL